MAFSSSGLDMAQSAGRSGGKNRGKAQCYAKRVSGGIETFVLSTSSNDTSTTNLNSLCGGRVTVAFEKFEPCPHILLMGGGHVAKAISEACDLLGWHHSVFDEREDFASPEMFPNASERINSKADEFLMLETPSSLARFSDILLLGHDWAIDQKLLIGLLSHIEELQSGWVALVPRQSGGSLRNQLE